MLDAQVDRLLADPRSQAFVEPFVTQWLEMGQPITLAMDHIQKQDFRFGRHLKASMQAETIAYVARVMAENRSTKELLASDWTMMNDILARHYGYPELHGGELRPVSLRKDDPRGGGLLGQAGLQSMLCWMGENWVIYRGAWALRHILDAPPPPPPLEVPELIASDAANHGKSFKDLLKQHQEDQRCAVCHKNIDPLGFAFQNFDLSGRWRDLEYHHYVKNDLDARQHPHEHSPFLFLHLANAVELPGDFTPTGRRLHVTTCGSTCYRWLQKHGIEVDEVCEHTPPALVYIDDRAIPFRGDWDHVITAIHDFRK